MSNRITFNFDSTKRVTDAWSEVVDRDTTTTDAVSVSIKNVGAGNITGINVYGQATNAGNYILIATSRFDEIGTYTRGSSGDPASIAAGSSVLFHLGVEYLAGIKIELVANAETFVEVSVGGYSE